MLKRIAIGMAPALLLAFHATAQDFQKGEAAYHRGDYATALKEFRLLADNGHARAQYFLGMMYEHGKGVRRDYSEAVKWHARATERGNPDAKVNLDFIYLTGRAVPKKASSAPVAGPRVAFKAPPAPAGGPFRVQLGAVKTEARAAKEAARLSRVHDSVLGDAEIALVRADLGRRGIFYRLQAGPLGDRAAAAALCRELSARDQACIVVKP